MSDTREELIRDHWKRVRERAMKPLKETGVFRCHILQSIEIVDLPLDAVATGPIEPPLEFRLEHGWYEGEQASRIVCEGVELEIGKRVLARPAQAGGGGK
jgi:hypothetical protein